MRDLLTDSELSFLRRHDLTPDDVFDGRNWRTWYWKQEAERLGKPIVLATECGKAGHRLRTRAGHCAECDPKKLAFLRRHSSTGHVYIAGSLSGKLIKIGTCGDCEQRWKQLNAEHYGGYGDWQMLFFITVERAGELEHRARGKLRRHAVTSSYFKDGFSQEATELLRCSYKQASDAILDALGEQSFSNTGWFGIESGPYEFELPDQDN